MKMLRKRKSILISLVVCLSFLLLFSQAAFAADSVRLRASNEDGVSGDEVTVTISIENAEGTEGGQFELIFDPDIVVPVDIAKGSFVSDAGNDQFNYNLAFDDDSLMVIWVTPEGDTDDSGVVCTIDFELLDEGDTSLTFAGVVIAPDDIDVSPTHRAGVITVDDEEAILQRAIDAANDAIADLPDPEDITLADKPDVEDARALVDAAKVLGAEDDDFDDLGKLEDAEEMIEKLEAIKAADDAIVVLPSVADLTLDDKPAVVAARALVDKAKTDHGAVDDDFTYLSILRAAENRIKELEGLVPTPPTGGMTYLVLGGLVLVALGILAYIKRNRLAVVK